MSAAEQRLRRALLVVVVAMCVGLSAELVLEEHTGDWIQFVPFVACGLATLAALAALRPLGRAARRLVLVVFVVTLGTGVVGIWEHYEHNLEFAQAIRPTESTGSLLAPALKGANPLLAPGAVGMVGVLGLLAVSGRSEADRKPRRASTP